MPDQQPVLNQPDGATARAAQELPLAGAHSTHMPCARHLLMYPLSAGEYAVLCERGKQRHKWSSAHDNDHKDGELALVAADLALESVVIDGVRPLVRSDDGDVVVIPWCLRDAITDPREQLIAAAALLIAEIDRRDRAPKGWE